MRTSTSNREGISDFLDKVVESISTKEAGVAKVASSNHPAEKGAASTVIAKTNHPSEKMSSSETTKKVATEEIVASEEVVASDVVASEAPVAAPVAPVSAEKVAKTEMTLHEARIARRTGTFTKVAGKTDLYQEAATNNYWKINGSKVIRAFDENDGIAVDNK
jgi:hypothetical protein